MNTVNEAYFDAYMKGYTDALEKQKEKDERPYIDVEGIVERYGGIGINKARNILQAVRHVCNGGKLNSSSMVLKSELVFWESQVEKKFIERL